MEKEAAEATAAQAVADQQAEEVAEAQVIADKEAAEALAAAKAVADMRIAGNVDEDTLNSLQAAADKAGRETSHRRYWT